MQEMITLYRKEAVFIGEVIEHEGKQYVVTHICYVDPSDSYPDFLEIEAICQEVGTESAYDEYEPVFMYEERHDLSEGTDEWYFDQLGETCCADGVCIMTTNILDVRYDEGYLVQEIEVTLIEPWSEEQIQHFVKQNRAAKFNVIEGQAGVDC